MIGVIALCYGNPPKVLAACAELIHIVLGNQGECCIGSAGSVRKRSILGKGAELAGHHFERTMACRISTNAGNYVGVARLHGSSCAPHGDNAGAPPVR